MIQNPIVKTLLSIKLVVLLVLLLSPFVMKTWVTKRLKDPVIIGEYTIKADQFHFTSLLNFTAETFTVTGPDLLLTIDKPVAHITPLSFGFGGKPFVSLESPYGFLDISSSKIDSNYLTSETPLPEFSIPLHCKALVPFFQIFNGSDTISIFETQAENLNAKSLIATADSLIAHTNFYSGSLEGQMSWNDELVVRYTGTMHSDSTYINASATSPKSNMKLFTFETNGLLQNRSTLLTLTPKLLPYLPDILDSINEVQFQGALQFDARNLLVTGALSTSLNTTAYWPATQTQWDGTVSLLPDTVLFTLAGRGTKGETIDLDGSVEGSDLSIKASIRGSTIELGSIIQTMDSPSILFSGNISQSKYDFSVLTPTKSLITGQMIIDTKGRPDILFEATVNPGEPWALAWTQDNIKIRPSRITGHFFEGAANITIHTSTPNTYSTYADFMVCNFTIDSEGLQFYDSRFVSGNSRYQFKGEVSWVDYDQFVKVEVITDNNGAAQFYSDFDANYSITVSELTLKQIPLIDSTLLAPFGGAITGTWIMNSFDTTGSATVLYQTLVNNAPLYLASKVAFFRDSVGINELTITHKSNTLKLNGVANNPEGNFMNLSLVEGFIEVDNFDLTTFSDAFLDGTITSGTLNGSSSYSDTSGVDGSLHFQDITLKNYTSDYFSVPRLTVEGLNDKLQVSARIKMGQLNQWDSEIAVDIQSIFGDQKKVSCAIVPDKGGLFVLNSTIDAQQNITGDFSINGPWALPNSIGQITESDIQATFSSMLKDGLHRPTVNINNASGSYTQSGEYIFPFSFNLTMYDSLITIPNGILINHVGESLKFKMIGKLNATSFLQELQFISRSFTYPISKNHYVTIEKVKGSYTPHPEYPRISLTSEETQYFYNDPTYGSTNGTFSNINLDYIIPTKNEQGTSKNHLISGSANTRKIIYRHMDFPELKITDFYKVQRFIQATANQRTENNTTFPIDLDVSIRDEGGDSLWVQTNYPSFPYTIDLSVRGTTTSPLLTGDITSIEDGTLKFLDAEYQITNVILRWDNQPITKGKVTFDFNKYFEQCQESDILLELEEEEKCNISMSLQGQVNNLELSHTASDACTQLNIDTDNAGQNGEKSDESTIPGQFSASNLFATLAANCVSNFAGFNAEMGINLLMKQSTNFINPQIKGLNTKINLKYNDVGTTIKATYYPIDDSPDLSLFGGYTFTNNSNADPKTVGTHYILPVLDNSATRSSNSPSKGYLSINGDVTWNANIDNKTSDDSEGTIQESPTETESDEYIPSAGISYNYKFWSWCFWGIGDCDD
ncbi:MAG: hypothetical protein OCD01_06850 [Fibrobacterales bacterium]